MMHIGKQILACNVHIKLLKYYKANVKDRKLMHYFVDIGAGTMSKLYLSFI